jgi:hypothetical protein
MNLKLNAASSPTRPDKRAKPRRWRLEHGRISAADGAF